jgi:uncharacterized membrane protein YphA (DoxX/SURF4 family)
MRNRALRIALGAIFFVAGLHKVGHTTALAQDIYNYHVLPDSYSYVYIAAAVLPWLELVLGAATIAGVWTESCALILMGLATLFTGAVASALWRHLDVNCGCLHGASKLSLSHLLFNLLILVLAAVLFRENVKKFNRHYPGNYD